MQALARADCAALGRTARIPQTLELFDVKYRRGTAFGYDFAMDRRISPRS